MRPSLQLQNNASKIGPQSYKQFTKYKRKLVGKSFPRATLVKGAGHAMDGEYSSKLVFHILAPLLKPLLAGCSGGLGLNGISARACHLRTPKNFKAQQSPAGSQGKQSDSRCRVLGVKNMPLGKCRWHCGFPVATALGVLNIQVVQQAGRGRLKVLNPGN